jgi:hypothetical protein
LLAATARADDGPESKPEAPAPPPGAEVRDGCLAFPNLRIYTKERRIELDGWVAQCDVLLEYVAVTSQGKLHESLFGVDCDPDMLQLGLILLGLEARPQVQYQGQPLVLEGPAVAVEAEWDETPQEGDGGAAPKRVRRSVAELVHNPYAATGAVESPGRFAFTGSRFIENPELRFVDAEQAAALPKEVLAAKASGNLIALYHDPDAILDNPLATGGDIPLLLPSLQAPDLLGWIGGDEFHRAATEKLPPRGTKVTLHLRPFAP